MASEITQPQRSIVLNIDGVATNANRYWLGAGAFDYSAETAGIVLEPTILKMLEKFCKLFGANIVIASAWSTLFPTARDFAQLFFENGADLPVIDVIKREAGGHWLQATRDYMADKPDVKWVLFADGPRFPPGIQNAIEVDAATGLTMKELYRAAEYFDEDAPETKELQKLCHSFGISGY